MIAIPCLKELALYIVCNQKCIFQYLANKIFKKLNLFSLFSDSTQDRCKLNWVYFFFSFIYFKTLNNCIIFHRCLGISSMRRLSDPLRLKSDWFLEKPNVFSQTSGLTKDKMSSNPHRPAIDLDCHMEVKVTIYLSLSIYHFIFQLTWRLVFNQTHKTALYLYSKGKVDTCNI